MIQPQVAADLTFSVETFTGGSPNPTVIGGNLRATGTRLVLSSADLPELLASVQRSQGVHPLGQLGQLRRSAARLAEAGLVLAVEGRNGTVIELGDLPARRRRRVIRLGSLRSGIGAIVLKSAVEAGRARWNGRGARG